MNFLEIMTLSWIYFIIGFLVIECAKVILHESELSTTSLEVLLGISISLNGLAKLNQNK